MTRRSTNSARRATRVEALVLLCAVLLTTIGVIDVAPARAATQGAGWEIAAQTYPTNLAPETAIAPKSSGVVAVDVFNVGAAPAGCTSGQRQREEAEAEQRHIEHEVGLASPLCPDGSPLSNPITVTDTLPVGLVATEAGELMELKEGGHSSEIGHALW
jgi:hypothetical protein